MKKLLMNRAPKLNQAWGGGNNFVKAICDFAPQYGYQVVHKFEPNLDAILIIDPRYDELGISINEIAKYKSLFPSTKVVHRVNECDKRKGTHDVDRLLIETSKVADISCFISEWIRDYFQIWHCPKDVVYSGTNREHFRPLSKMNNGVRESPINNEKINLVTHHWSNNLLKGFDIYDKLDKWIADNDLFTFTYIGRERGTFKNTKVIGPLFGQALGDELRKYDMYISASRWDPGPNHIIESLACGLPTYAHIEGGGAAEFVGKENTYHTFEELIDIISCDTLYKSEPLPITSWSYSWADCMKIYFEIIDA